MNTIRGNPNFNAEEGAAKLRKAMKGFGTDEDAIIDVCVTHNNVQRLEILSVYKAAYGRDLIHDLKSELSGNFLKVVKALFTPYREYLAECVHRAIEGMGTDEEALVELLCCRTNYEMEALKDAYKEKYSVDLESDLKSDLSGDFKRLIRAITCGRRNETAPAVYNDSVRDAKELLEAGIRRLGTDESTFFRVLSLRSYSQLRSIFEAYRHVCGEDFETTLKKEFSGDVLAGLLAIARVSVDPSMFFAKLLHKAMQGIGTDDDALIHILVTRSQENVGPFQVDLEDIKAKYRDMYKVSLPEAVKKETSGDYRKILLKMLGN